MLRRIFNNIIYCFPFHLLLYHIKKNQVLLAFWGLLWLIISGTFGASFGVPYLFLDPEYLDKVDFWSFLLVGFSLGGFTMAFHITSYILDGYRYNFLAALPRPFMKFSINNSVIPFAFILYYIYKIVVFQSEFEEDTMLHIIIKVTGFLFGFVLMIASTFFYFSLTNKDIFKIFSENVDKRLKKNRLQRVNLMDRMTAAKKKKVVITSYLTTGLRFRKVNNNHPYDKEMLLRVFDQNQLNAVTIQLMGFVTIILLGIFRDVNYFQLPAAASALLLASITLLFSGAISYWLKEWAVSITVAVIFLLTFLVGDSNSTDHKAFGLRYDIKAEYSVARLQKLSSQNNILNDKIETIEILENWKRKAINNNINSENKISGNGVVSKNQKPPLILICSSGGGLRSAIWTLRTLQYLDSTFSGDIMKNTVLMTGSSGGIVGSAYFRELQLQKVKGSISDSYDLKYLNQMAKDKLNAVVFSLVVSDLFFKFEKFAVGGQQYYKDRGYALEQGFLEGSNFMLDKPLSEYYEVEKNAEIPMLIMSPTIINDGRKLLISPQKIAYLTKSFSYNKNVHKIKAVEFSRFFKEQNADSLRFVTALRMNATFPYITPNVVLPSVPTMETIDAGLSDNFGVSLATNFLYVFRDWIKENTSKVILISIRDTVKEPKIKKNTSKSVIKDLLNPIANLLSNISNFQDINNDNQIEYAYDFLGTENVYKVDFQYSEKSEDAFRASLNWRLTTKEKKSIIKAISSDFNKKSEQRLKQLLYSE